MSDLPAWAQDMSDLFRTGSVSQFIIYGNIFDVVPARTPAGHKQLSLKAFLEEMMFASYDVVIEYDRSKGIRVVAGPTTTPSGSTRWPDPTRRNWRWCRSRARCMGADRPLHPAVAQPPVTQ